MGLFRVKIGQHTTKGATFGQGLPAGDVVDSERDLVRLYGPEKFAKLSDEESKEHVKKSKSKKASPDVDEATAPAARQDPTVAGAKGPDGFPLDKDNVHDLPVNEEEEEKPSKGKKAASKESDKAAKEEDADDADESDEEEDEKSSKVTSKLGENVTSQYPKADEGDLLVFRKGRSFHVTERDDPETALNKSPLAKGALGKFLAKQLKG